MKTLRLFLLAALSLATAARAATFTVSNTADSGAGSLRQAVADAASQGGADTILFDSGLSGQTIILASEIVLGSPVTLDATALPAGLTLHGGGFNFSGNSHTYRHFTVSAGQTAALHGLTLRLGGGYLGGAIYNAGTLTMDRCTFTQNFGAYGAAIFNETGGMLTLRNCTLASNGDATPTLEAGALYNRGTATLVHCTVSVNTAVAYGGIYNDSGSTLTVENTIASANNSYPAYRADIRTAGPVVRVGANIIGYMNGSGTPSGPLHITSDQPLLGDLGNYGGSTRTMPPLPGSPAINAAVGSTTPTDQRGLSRPQGSAADIGAVEVASATALTVTSTADSGPGSLRRAIADAAALPGADTITFDPSLSGQTITLTSEIVVADTGGITVDASSLLGGITLSGGTGTNRIFSFASGSIVVLNSLTLTGGDGGGAFDSGRGGAIYSNFATLTLHGCTLHGNSASSAAGDGGAIFASFGTLSLTNCTLTANTAGWRGGAVFNKGTLALTHCTVSGNSAAGAGLGEGGGIFNDFVSATLENSIVSGNTAASGFGIDILQDGGTLTRVGANIIGRLGDDDLFNGGTATGPPHSIAAPNLAALASNGGPTQTLMPNAGSPALDAAVGSTTPTDQRGFARPQGGAADIGAVEAENAAHTVTSTADSGPGSLRQAIANAALSPGADTITFGFLHAGADGAVYALAVQSDGRVLIGGDFASINGTSRSRVARLNSDGALDTSFSIGTGANGTVTSIGLQLDGKVLLCGSFTSINGTTRNGIARLNSDGSLDASFNPASLANGAIRACAVDASGKVLIAGDFTAYSSVPRNRVARLNSDGTLDTAFSPGSGANSVVRAVAAQPDGKVFIGGDFSSFNGTSRVRIARLSADGSLDTAFDPGTGPNDTVISLMPQPDGQVIAMGKFTMVNSTGRAGIARFAANGTLDASFNPAALVNGSIFTAAAQTDGKIIIGGDFTTCGGIACGRIARLTASWAAVDATFHSSSHTITLTTGHLTLGHNFTIDASALPNGITISGGSDGDSTLEAGESRIFDIPAGATVVLRRLNLINGIADPADSSLNGAGGAIRSSGQLTVDQCTLSACRANAGAGLAVNGGSATLIQSTLSGNSATGSGGAIFSGGGSALTLTRCTVSGNTASVEGGAVRSTNAAFTATHSTFSINTALIGGACSIADNGPGAVLAHCTIAGNTATGTVFWNGVSNVNGGGGGLFFYDKNATLTHCLIAGNTSPATYGVDVEAFGGNFIVSGNLIGDNDTVSATFPAGPLVGTPASPLNAQLAPLASNGGPTQTMRLLPGSPARSAATGSTATTDQRGFPIFDTPDIGAYEAQLGPIAATTTNEDTATAAIPFIVGTVGTLSATSSNTSLVPDALISLGGSGGNRTLTATPAAHANGIATLTVTDSLSGETQTFQLTVTAVNDAPSFTKGADQNLPAGSGAQSITGWATALSDGDPEVTQTLSFTVMNTNHALFTTQPAISSDGTLTYTPSGAGGSATVSVTLQDDGGTATGGQNSSGVQTFTITITLLSTVISSSGDSGPGSLRQAVLDAAQLPGADTLTFAPAFTGPITLASEITLTSSVTIDGGSSGLTIDGGPGANRIFTVNSGQTVILRNLTLTGGNGAGAADNGFGGAILNYGTLSLTNCTLSGNTSTTGFGYGGAIANFTRSASDASLTMISCTVSGNTSSGTGGGLSTVPFFAGTNAPVVLRHCTFTANTAASGGAIYTYGVPVTVTPVEVTHCTIAGNTATTLGGGIRNQSQLTLTNSIVAGNSDTPAGTTTDNIGGTPALVGNNLTSGDPLLAPLANYGGPTQTRALLPGSPARNAASLLSPTIITDQRGYPIVGTPDIGAYEAGTLSNFAAFAAETPGTPLTLAGDADHDGRSDLLEYATQSDPNAPSSGEITPATYNTNALGAIIQANVTFPTRVGATDLIYILQRSTTLTGIWTPVATWNATTGVLTVASGATASRHPGTGLVSVTDTNVSGEDNAFYQVKVEQVP